MLKPLYCCEDYLVSDEGYILSKTKNTPLKYSLNHKGYCINQIMVNGERKGIALHIAVARTFMPDQYKEGLQVNHIDGNKQNNKLSNLEFVTPIENIRHCIDILGKDKKRNKNSNTRPVRAINKQESIQFDSIIQAPEFIKPDLHYENKDEYKKLRAVELCIHRALNGYLKTYHGYTWEYI